MSDNSGFPACRWYHLLLLHEAHGRRRDLRCFLDGAKLRFVPGDVFAQRPPDSLGVTWAYDHALQQLSLGAVRKNINKIKREFFQIVMNHQQIAVFTLEFLLIRLDLNLPLRRPLLVP